MKVLKIEDITELQKARDILENPSLLVKLTNYVGKPIEMGIDVLPTSAKEAIQKATQKALDKSLDLALVTLGKEELELKAPSNITHKFISGVSGAIGGFFGLAGLGVELPISTTLMLRSIADIARSEGFSLQDREVQLNCLEIFALGSSKNPNDNELESSYYGIRAGLSYGIKEAVSFLSKVNSDVALQNIISSHQAPMLVKLIGEIANRFGITVSQKVLASSIPILGSLSSATINVIFLDYYQDIAKAHFTIKRLEREYGEEFIKKEYTNLK